MPQITFSVLDHGASADNSGDANAAAFQAAVNAAAAAGGGTVDFSESRLRFDGVLTFPPLVSARGGGSLVFSPTAKWVFGDGNSRQVSRAQVSGIRFGRQVGDGGSAIPASSVFIEIDRCRELKIHHCSFAGADRAISHKANPSTSQHDNGMISITDNQFTDVNYAWYVDVDPSAPWGATSDSAFARNMVNVAFITHVHCEAIDGVNISDNVFFFPSYQSTNPRKFEKKNNIYIGQSNFAIIHDNNCFEAGEEGIKLNNTGTATISGNNIAWPGQLVPSDGIFLHGIGGDANARLAVTGNTVTYYTRHAVFLSGDANSCSIGLNGVVYARNSRTYIGSTPLGSDTDHHRYFFDDSFTLVPIVEDGYSGRPGESDRYPGGVTGVTRSGPESGSVSARMSGIAGISSLGRTLPVFSCSNLDERSTSYSGMIMISVTSQATSASATYVLLVTKSGANGVTTSADVSRSGDFQGNDPGDPGFAWSFEGDVLHARPVRSTAGGFDFSATTYGNVSLKAAG